jgi:quercetin dioxygenase-like cupin family protein
MKEHKVGVASVLALAMTLGVVSAQQPTIKRTVLQQHDISVAGHEAVMARAEIPAGGSTGRHTHPGEEISYVLEGSLLLEVDGQPAKTFKAGEVFMVPAGVIHNGTNKTSANATVIATYVVEKGKPLTTPAK